MRVRAEPLAEAASLIGAVPDVDEVTSVDGLLDVAVDTSQASAINRLLVEAGIAVSELYAQRDSLEHVFFELTVAFERDDLGVMDKPSFEGRLTETSRDL